MAVSMKTFVTDTHTHRQTDGRAWVHKDSPRKGPVLISASQTKDPSEDPLNDRIVVIHEFSNSSVQTTRLKGETKRFYSSRKGPQKGPILANFGPKKQYFQKLKKGLPQNSLSYRKNIKKRI